MRNLRFVLVLILVSFLGNLSWAMDGSRCSGSSCLDDESSDRSQWDSEGHNHFSQGEKNFEKVKDTLLKKYVDEKITDNDLYEAATRGMLQNLGHQKWDKLLSPAEREEFNADFSGEVTGIGIGLKFDGATGNADVIDVVPGTPAEKAGLQVGDEIIKVDGQFFKGRTFREMVEAIRGKEGEAVHLRVLRGDKIVSKDLTREKIKWVAAHGIMIAPKVGLLPIEYFMMKTPELVRQSLENLQAQGAKDIILDLRENRGGLFDAMIDTASLFLPEGKTIVTTIARGGEEKNLKAKGAPVFKGGGLVILVNKETSSSAEILAAALKENMGVKVVGQTTFGKWNVQSIEDLPNGFAIKYTVDLLKTPRGESLDGKGLQPDVIVDMDSDLISKSSHAKSNSERVAMDAQLRTGLGLLEAAR